MSKKQMMTRGLFGVLSIAVCQWAAVAGENVDRIQSPLIAPTLVTAAQQEQLGLLSMTMPSSCSASLLNNDWVVSAAHCLDGVDVRQPGNVRFSSSWATPEVARADYIYRFWGLDELGSTYDIALFHLRAPFRVNGSMTGYVRELTALSLKDMETVNIAVYGRGFNTLASNTRTGPMPASGDGLYRSAVFTVNRIEPTLFWYPRGEHSETVIGGDSGGPSFEMTRGAPRLAGVHAACDTRCLAGQVCPKDDPWTWVGKILECGDAPVGYVGGFIQEIIKQSWNPALPIQTIHASHTEGQVQKDLLLGHIDTLPWDYVRRAATRMCANRGFSGGFLDGNARPGERYQLRCLGDGAGRWYDALPAHMAKISDKFRTSAQLHWAQGARAANDLCKVIDPASVGGILTGSETITEAAPSGGFYDQKNGVFCFNKSHATLLDSAPGEFNAQGTPIGDLNYMKWAPASRAATEYCRRRFYPAGGFFNGHQLDGKRGVVCLGKNTAFTEGLKPRDMQAQVREPAANEMLKPSDMQAQAREPAATGAKPAGISSTSRTAIGTQSAVASVGGARAPAAVLSTTQSVPAPVTSNAAPAVTMFYAIEADGTLSEYRHDLPENGTAPVRFAPSSAGWNTYAEAIPAGGNHFYARAQNGDLLWYQHDGVGDGADAWRGPTQVGNGWQSFVQIFGGGDGVIYAIAPDGALMWYRHAGFPTGDPRAWLGPRKIGTGWQSFKHVFSAGQGAIYAITQDGKLMLYRHLDPMNGEMRWSGPTQVGTGWHGFVQVFSTGNGVIYGVAPDGKLSYYRHLTWNAAQPTLQWVGPVAVGQNFNPAARIMPMLP